MYGLAERWIADEGNGPGITILKLADGVLLQRSLWENAIEKTIYTVALSCHTQLQALMLLGTAQAKSSASPSPGASEFDAGGGRATTTGALTGTKTGAAAVASPSAEACTRNAAAATSAGTDAGASADTRAGAGPGPGAAVGATGLIIGGLLAAPGNCPTGRLTPPGPMTCIGFQVDLACSAFAAPAIGLSLKGGATGAATAGGHATAYGGGGPA